MRRTAATHWLLLIAVNALVLAVATGCLWVWLRHRLGLDDTGPVPVAALEAQGWRVDAPAGGSVTAYRPERLCRPDADLGWSLAPGQRVQERAYHGAELLYEATYCIDTAGWRVTPGPVAPDARALLLLGCSFVFGQGLDDDATIAAQVRRQTAGRAMAVNLGVPGYGPHQTLAFLQAERERLALRDHPVLGAVYLAAPFQVERSVGRWTNAGGDPRFELDGWGVRRVGVFEKPSNSVLPRTVLGLLLPRLSSAWPWPNEQRRHDELLYVALLKSIDELLRQRYNIPLTVVLWPSRGPFVTERLRKALEARGLRTARADALTGEFDLGRLTIPRDQHPNVAGARLIARVVLRHWSATSGGAVPWALSD
jgi:hypothetical protein